jgi:hypothetical protein
MKVTAAVARFACCVILCTSTAVCAHEEPVHLLVSRDFERPLLLQKSLRANNRSVLQLLQSAAETTTAYGGGFVTSINGIPPTAGGGTAWHYYVNGVLAAKGARAYLPRPGDVIQWDFHPWAEAWPVPAIVGAFPQPLAPKPGEKPRAAVLYGNGFRDAAHTLSTVLKSKQPVPLPDAMGHPISGKTPLILLGRWETIRAFPLLAGLSKHARTCGLFAQFHPDGVTLLDRRGKPSVKLPGAGLILALSTGLPGTAPLWIITGLSAEDVNRAVTLLAGRPETVRGLAGVAVTGARLYPLPARTSPAYYTLPAVTGSRNPASGTRAVTIVKPAGS